VGQLARVFYFSLSHQPQSQLTYTSECCRLNTWDLTK